MLSKELEELEEHLNKKLDDNKKKIDGESKRFDKAMREIGKRLDNHAAQIGIIASDAHDAKSAATKAWKETQKMNQTLTDAHIYETADVFKGGATIAKGIIYSAKVLTAISIVCGSIWASFQAFIHWRSY